MIEFQLPELGEAVNEVEMVEWLVHPGQSVKPGQGLAEVMTDKATMEVPARFGGVIGELRAKPGEKVKIGDVVLTYEPDSQNVAANGEPELTSRRDLEHKTVVNQNGDGEKETKADAVAEAQQPRVKAAPSVREMAREMAIDLGQVDGTGPDGRVLMRDLANRVRVEKTVSAPKDTQWAPDFGIAGERRPYVGLRRHIGQRMVAAKREIPHYSYVDECDVTSLKLLRQSLAEELSVGGVKLTYLPFFVKAAAMGLIDVPLVNSSLDESKGEIVLHDHRHIGFAVATREGLLVPVITHADRKGIGQIAREIAELSQSARDGAIGRQRMQGGTFTVTSIGGIGGLISTPIINSPQAAIMGVGKMVRRPEYDENGDLRPADKVYLSFTFDHRIVDGAIGAAFANEVIRRLQRPELLLWQ